MRISESVDHIRDHVLNLANTFGSEDTDMWITLPQASKLFHVIARELELALDGDETYSEKHGAHTLEHRISERVRAFEFQRERVTSIRFAAEGGSDYDNLNKPSTNFQTASSAVTDDPFEDQFSAQGHSD